MTDAEIKARAADILAHEAAIINMINGWVSNAKTNGFPVLHADAVPAGTDARQGAYRGFPVLIDCI
ncbi:MAG TPA: hypothetical protein VJ654_00705 [Noviherbaspirillum sp.]|nr:hypothetical protein [Noviherbaspirillum sp.]